ncbi:MAG TPA: oligosaccharide flippase family protein [Rickettsiales bacterium]|nr:oligosaccharide flippase family protein [Rickettsiales bacterium]
MAIFSFIQRYLAKLKRDDFARNVLVMFTGTALGQFCSVLLSPLLTRIYSPEMFGVLGVFTAVVGILSTVATLRYEMALPLVRTQTDAANLLAVCIAALVITVTTAAAVVGGISIAGAAASVFGVVAPYRWFMPLGLLCIGAYNVLLYYATRQHDFRVIARTKLYQGGVGPVSQIVLGLMGAGIGGLVTGSILGQSAGIGYMTSRLLVAPRALAGASMAGMGAIAKRFRHFFLVSSWAGIIEEAGNGYLLLMVMPVLYSSTAVGFIFLTDRIIGRPLLLISTSILQVYVGDVSRSIATDPGAVRRRFLQMAGQQFVIVAGWLLLVNVVAPYVIPLVFGEAWAGTVPYLRVLSIAYLPRMVLHAITHTLQVLEKQMLSALWEAGRLIALIGAFFISYRLGFDALHALLAYSIVQAAAHLLLFILMYKSIQSLQKVSPDEEIAEI